MKYTHGSGSWSGGDSFLPIYPMDWVHFVAKTK